MINTKVLQHFEYEEFKETVKIIEQEIISNASFRKAKVDKCNLENNTSSRSNFVDIAAQQTLLSVWDFTSKTGGKKHTVAVGRDVNGFFFHCGTLPSDEKDSICNYFKNPLSIVDPNALRTFDICKHIAVVIYFYICHDNQFFTITLPELESDWQRKYGDKSVAVATNTDELAYLKRFAFKANVLIEGDRGSGKTYDVNKLADELEIAPIMLGGHAGVESIDLLGHLVPYNAPATMQKAAVSASDLLSGASLRSEPRQQLVWKDGALTEAFRKAANGQKSILILDELLRIPQRELNILLTALSPINGKYTLRTGRIISVENGVANEEVIKAPVENLFVTATTNVGGQYAIDDIDPALAERFIVVRKDTTVAQLKNVLSKYAEDKGLDNTLVLKIIEFYKKMQECKKQGILENAPTTRTLSRAIQLSDGTEDDVWNYIKDQILLWIGRNTEGYPIEEQRDVVIKTISIIQSKK